MYPVCNLCHKPSLPQLSQTQPHLQPNPITPHTRQQVPQISLNPSLPPTEKTGEEKTMRNIIALCLIVFSPLASAKEAKRAPNYLSSGEKRIVTFHCLGEESGTKTAIGLVKMAPTRSKNFSGSFELDLSLKGPKFKGNIQTRLVSDQFTMVPEGFVLRAQWKGTFTESTLIHLHPEEKTSFPGVAEKSQCAIDQELNSLEN